MKIADPSMTIDKQGVVEHCTLVFFAKKFEDLPISQRVGDIIRVHRAGVGMYKNVKQFTSNVFFNSSWAIFSPVVIGRDLEVEEEKINHKISLPREFEPFLFYGKAFSFDNTEKKIITNLRKWIGTSFSKQQMLSN